MEFTVKLDASNPEKPFKLTIGTRVVEYFETIALAWEFAMKKAAEWWLEEEMIEKRSRALLIGPLVESAAPFVVQHLGQERYFCHYLSQEIGSKKHEIRYAADGSLSSHKVVSRGGRC